ncbi:hypothetical protein CHS0354_036461 [Potamilus streckersoni]|uniref:RING-type E3 ubiquitin transferase n=1 Tax=Potamilus streckersoni TaxID=2493646 RepID=A0AAE0W401_9BIVA|nr:hypothetical protein CHS0354_036461 [Potamilus streckersoni]
MGNQGSGHSNRGTSADLSNLRSDWPLQFHDIHGDNIKLSPDKLRAKRADSFCKGICFSNRPVSINEKVYIRFYEISCSWSGVLRFGFTTVDPGTLEGSNLPRYACPDLTNKPGYWAKALAERYAVVNNVLYFYVTRSGDVLYGVNGDDKGIFFSGVNTNAPIWAVMDIYGNTIAVEFTQPETPVLNNMISVSSQGNQQTITSSMSSLTLSSRERQLPCNLSISPRCNINMELSPIPFHMLCGRNIRLSHDKTEASRIQEEYCNGYVFTSRPLRCGEKIVIVVQGVDRSYVGGLALGFTACDPANIRMEDLPDDADLLLDRMEYWVVNKDICRNPEVGEELSFHLTNEGEVCYSRNKQKMSTLMHVDRTLPLWAFFDVFGNVQKIKLLGVTVPKQPRPMPRSISSSGSLTVTLPHPNRLAITPTTTHTSMDPHRTGVVRSFSVPASGLAQSAGHKPLPPLPASDPVTPLSTLENPIADNEYNECNVCYERPVNAVLYTCGHLCMCYECAIMVKQERGSLCPICRQEIRDVIKIYRS